VIWIAIGIKFRYKMAKICVFGASGFVGRALIERLNRSNYEVISAIHSPGNAWSILRFETPIVIADLLNKASIGNALRGCDYVVNLSLGRSEEMLKQLKNLIEVCKENQIKRLIHISSITVYGDFPHPDSKYETGPCKAKRKSYGWYKMKQDDLIKEANDTGLSSISLCPPHITGAYGRIFHQVIDSIKEGSFVLLEDGALPCNIVDVNNICHAIELSIILEQSDGCRVFITNGDDYTWRDLAEQAAKVLGKSLKDIPVVSKEEFLKISDRVSLASLVKKALMNEDLKKELANTILVKNRVLNKISKKIYARFKRGRSNYLWSPASSKSINYSLCKQQLRGVRHEIIRARDILNYTPLINSKQSFAIFENYYTTLFGYNTEYWDLVV